jgi:hypothetical protein
MLYEATVPIVFHQNQRKKQKQNRKRIEEEYITARREQRGTVIGQNRMEAY